MMDIIFAEISPSGLKSLRMFGDAPSIRSLRDGLRDTSRDVSIRCHPGRPVISSPALHSPLGNRV
jgi:hypothetical protein